LSSNRSQVAEVPDLVVFGVDTDVAA